MEARGELVRELAAKVETVGLGDLYADQPSVRLYRFRHRDPGQRDSWVRCRPYFVSEAEWESNIRGSAFDLVAHVALAEAAEAKRRCACALASAIGGIVPQDVVMRIWAEAYWR